MFKEEKSEIEMSKELIELNSIEIIKNMFIDYDKNFEYYGDFPTLNLERKKAIEIVLNLLEKQKAEIEDKDREIIRLGRKANEYKKAINCKDCDCCICEAHINTLELRAEIEKKDIALRECERNLIEERQNRIKEGKIIDLMANHIATSDSNLCQYLDMTTKCKYYAGDNGKLCDNCIKQYFEKKAEESK